MVFPSADQIILDDIFVALPGFIKYSTAYLKIESYNPGGSIKMKTAASLLDYAEQHARSEEKSPRYRIIFRQSRRRH